MADLKIFYRGAIVYASTAFAVGIAVPSAASVGYVSGGNVVKE